MAVARAGAIFGTLFHLTERCGLLEVLMFLICAISSRVLLLLLRAVELPMTDTACTVRVCSSDRCKRGPSLNSVLLSRSDN